MPELDIYRVCTEACFIRRISVASNAIQTIDNEMIHLIIHCLNCIRRDRNATYKTGLVCRYPRIASTESETRQKFQIIYISQCTLNRKLSKNIRVDSLMCYDNIQGLL